MTGDSSWERLEALAANKKVSVRVSAASDPATHPQLLKQLASDPSPAVRRVIASRADTPPETLRALAQDRDRQTRQTLTTNPSSPQAALIALLADAHWSVRWAVVDNPAADVAVRRAICQSDDTDMRAMLAQRSNLEREIVDLLQRDSSTEVRAALATETDSPAALASLLDDPEPRVRAAAGMNGHTTAEQRRRLVHDPVWQVRNSVAQSKVIHGWRIPEEDLLLLARDRSVNVRYWLANLPGGTRRTYEVLAEDPDQMVANTAKRWLLPPDHPQHPNNSGEDLQALEHHFGIETIHPEHTWGPDYLGKRTPHAQLPPFPPAHPSDSEPGMQH